MSKKKSKMPPYPEELKEELYRKTIEKPGVQMGDLLRELFADNPQYGAYKSRLTVARAYAVLGARKRKGTKRNARFTDLPLDSELRQKIRSVAQPMKEDGKVPRVILAKLIAGFPNVAFPPARLLMQLLFPKKGPARAPKKQYAIEGDGFRIEITYCNPKMVEKIKKMVGLLLEE